MAEKTLNDLPRELRQLYSKGQEAAQRENFDYAIALFNQILEKAPGCFDCRESLRNAQSQKAGKRGGFFKKMMSTASSTPQVTKARMTLNKNPLEALHIAEQILNGDPYNSGAHKIAADAALAAGFPKTAVLSLETLWQNNPKDKDLVIQFADALADIGEVERAEKVLGELVRANPSDPDISKALKNISARRTMREGGYDALEGGKGSFRDILKDKDEAVSLEQEQRAHKTEDVAAKLIGEYEVRLKSEPNNLKLIRNLAELYAQKKEFDKSLEFYGKLKATVEAGNDPSLDRAIAEMMVKKFAAAEAELNPFAPDHAEQVAKLKAEQQAFQLAECQKRAEKFPTDLSIRFELGQLYFQAGKVNEAIQEFQKAQANPNKKVAAMGFLAQCYARKNMSDMAARKFQEAIKEKVVFDDEKKDLIYNLGAVLEKMGKREEAIEQFKQIYEADIGYKDVAAKVDAFYAGQ